MSQQTGVRDLFKFPLRKKTVTQNSYWKHSVSNWFRILFCIIFSSTLSCRSKKKTNIATSLLRSDRNACIRKGLPSGLTLTVACRKWGAQFLAFFKNYYDYILRWPNNWPQLKLLVKGREEKNTIQTADFLKKWIREGSESAFDIFTLGILWCWAGFNI